MKLIVRPKGCLYIVYSLIRYIFLIGLLTLAIFALIEGKPFSGNNIIDYISGIFVILMMAAIFSLIVLLTWQIIRYKLIIYDDHIQVVADRDLFLIRHKDIYFKFEGIKILQYQKVLRPDLLSKGIFFYSAICITRDNNKSKDCLLTIWYSNRQINYILETIKIKAEDYNNYSIDILN